MNRAKGLKRRVPVDAAPDTKIYDQEVYDEEGGGRVRQRQREEELPGHVRRVHRAQPTLMHAGRDIRVPLAPAAHGAAAAQATIAATTA